jgi:hypothetical protein
MRSPDPISLFPKWEHWGLKVTELVRHNIRLELSSFSLRHGFFLLVSPEKVRIVRASRIVTSGQTGRVAQVVLARHVLYYFVYGITGVWTQGLVLARQVLYHFVCLFMAVLGFEFRTLCLLGRCSAT